MAVATGQCRVGVAWRSRKRGSGARPWATEMYARPSVPAAFCRPFGLLRPVDEVAVLTRRYMHDFGATRDHLANVALAVRKMANRNPRAIMYEREMTREQYMNARWISEPLCLFDNCLETDGALACVLVSAERARDCRKPPAYLHAFGQGFQAQHQTMSNYFCDDPLTGPSWACAAQLYREPDFQPQDISVAQLYDAFTPLIVLSLEGYGFCKKGEGAAFTEDGALDLGYTCETSVATVEITLSNTDGSYGDGQTPNSGPATRSVYSVAAGPSAGVTISIKDDGDSSNRKLSKKIGEVHAVIYKSKCFLVAKLQKETDVPKPT